MAETEEQDSETSYDEELLAKLLRLIISKYPPASAKDADTFLTTKQIFEALQEMYPADYSEKTLFELLAKTGYQYDITSEFKFQWMLRKAVL